MSQKNFASYGDMETLFTEIGEKLGEKGGKLYLHTVDFAIKSVYELLVEDNLSDRWRNNKTAVAIGVYRDYDTQKWTELIIDGTQKYGLHGTSNLKNGTSEYAGTTPAYNSITLYIISKIPDQFTNPDSLKSHFRRGNILTSLNPYAFYERSSGKTLEGFNNSEMIIHITPEISGDSTTNFVDRMGKNADEPERYLFLNYSVMLKEWSDVVTEWN